METFFKGQEVKANVKGVGWTDAKVLAVQPDGKVDVTVTRSGDKASGLLPANVHGAVPGAYDAKEPDLFRVNDLHPSTLLFCLKERYETGHVQYSRMGEMILSVNPFQPLEINNEASRKKYLAAPDPGQLPPHVWQISDRAYKRIVAGGLGNQSVVISGDSGSGKTENTKAMIAFLGGLSHRNSANEMQRSIVERVNTNLARANPILESFGNARTVRNDNSSRFGKYVKLLFDAQSGVMIGGAMETYLLEKSRIVTCGEGERAYHVFYEMLAGLPPSEKQRLGLRAASEYASLNRGNTLTRRGADGQPVDDAVEFRNLATALNAMGIEDAVQRALWTVLAAILHFLDVKFTKNSDEKAAVETAGPLATACGLLGVDPEALKPCFLVRSRSKILTTMSTKTEAEGLRDSLCKALYVGVFDSLVAAINKAIAPTVDQANTKYIGVLDIFGFENFKVNSFEQLCINFANESLQNHYNKNTFVDDRRECEAEGVEFPNVEFPDNTACLQMFDQAKTGVFALLDEACYTKGGTTAGFTGNVWEMWTGKSTHFLRPKSTAPVAFGIRHYACDVTYATDGWLEKNSDPLKEEAKAVLAATKAADNGERAFIAGVLENADCTPSDGQSRKRVSVSTRFRSQLAALRKELEGTETHYVRCVKPNLQAIPGALDNEHVSSQLESAGVLQTIAVKRQGYPARRELPAFARFFHSLGPATPIRKQIAAGDMAGACRSVLELYVRVFDWKPPHYAVGKSKVFMKAHIWGALERTLLRRNRMRLRRCIPLLRRWAGRFRARKEEAARQLREAAVQQQRGEVDIGTERSSWFDDLCRLFPSMDPTIVYDVVGHPRLTSKADVARKLSEMRAAEFDQHVPAAMMSLLERAHVAKPAIQKLMAAGVDNLKKLYELTPETMTEKVQLTEAEKKHVTEVIVQQSSRAVRNQCLLVSGTGELPAVTEEKLEDLAQAEARARTVRDKVHALATVLGCGAELAAIALRDAKGDENLAAGLIADGRVSVPRPAPVPATLPGATSPSVGPPSASLPRGPPPASNPAPPQRVPPTAAPASPPRGGPPINQRNEPPRPVQQSSADEAALRRLTQELGFGREESIAALRRANGDFRMAAAILAGAA